MRAGYVRVAGVATAEARAAVAAFGRERGLPTFSQALGAALEAWLAARRSGVTNPPAPPRGRATPEGGSGGSNTVAVTLAAWQEVRGTVRSVERTDEGVRVVLEHAGRSMELTVPSSLADVPCLAPGRAVAVLRTDNPAREYIVRPD